MEEHIENIERHLIHDLKQGSHKAFDKIYQMYSKRLYAYSLQFTKSSEESEEIVTARARSFLSKAADLTDGRKSAWQRTVSLLMEILWPEEESAWGNVFCFPIIETGSG